MWFKYLILQFSQFQDTEKKLAPIPPILQGFPMVKTDADPWNSSEPELRGQLSLFFWYMLLFRVLWPLDMTSKKRLRSGEKLDDTCLCVIWKWSTQTIQCPKNGRKCMKIYILKIDRSFLWLLPVIFVQGKQKQTWSAPLNGVDSGTMAGYVEIQFCCHISSRIVILVLIQRIYIYIIWFNGHNLAYPPILRYTWGCIPTIVIMRGW